MVFLSQKDDGNIICTDYWNVLVLTISGMGNTVLFEPKSWWKDDIYCSCFEFFGDGKSLFSWVKKLMERWHLLVTEKFLFFGDGKYGFFKPKCWWKDDISLVFFSFPWYSRTWKIWFFAQWLHKFDQIIDSQRLRLWNIRCNALKL